MKSLKILMIYLIFILFTFSFCNAQSEIARVTSGQEVALLASQELNQATINGVLSIEELVRPDDWSLFNRSLGEPLKVEETHDFVEDYAIIEYEGAVFEYSSYTGSFELVKMVLHHPDYWIHIDGKKVYPSMAAEELQKLFPEAFRLKKNNRLSFFPAIIDQQGQLQYRDDGQPLISDVESFTIVMDETSQNVVEIILSRRII